MERRLADVNSTTMIHRLSALALALLLALSVAGCPGKGRRGAARTEKPPIILIVIDTLRADHVGANGYGRNTTPNIDAFAKTATRFSAAHAAASWTVPSMASMFSGVYPWGHGVVMAEVSAANQVDYQLTLSDQFETMAETLAAEGYETFGVSANYHMHEKYGMSQGFAHYKTFGFRDREPVDLQVKDWIPQMRRAMRQGKPYFLYVHYFDPHHPYLPVDPFIRQWRPEFDMDRIKELVGEGFIKRAVEGEFFRQPETLQLFVDLYDSEISAADDSVGKLLANLPQADQALVVVTADHGEAFGEHNNMIHGRDMYAETLHVPLVVRFPGQLHAGKTIDNAVSLVDLYPTLAEAAGAEQPRYLDGQSLRRQIENPPKDRYLFAETQRAKEFYWRGVITTGQKWLYHVQEKKQEFYNIAADPGETKDLYQEGNREAASMAAKWRQHRRREPVFAPGNAGEISPELRDQLKNLGYL
jgi:arylsulfatase A-like enzyme